MKSSKVIIFVFIFFFFSTATLGQLWKQHADSAYSFYDQRKYNLAIEYGDKAREELAKDSFWTNTYAHMINDLASLYRYLNKHEKAETIFLEAKLIREKVLGKEHPDYAITCGDLGFLYDNMAQYEKAELLMLEEKQIMERAYGKEHPAYAHSCNVLGILYMDMGKYQESESLYLEAKNIILSTLGKDDPLYISVCYNLGLLYLDMGQYEKAELFSIEAKKMRRKTLGIENPDYAASCDNLAGIYTDLGLYEKAEPLYLEAKEIWANVFGKNHSDYAQICNNLGNLYFAMGHISKAESLYLEAKQIWGKLQDKEDSYAIICNNLGGLYLEEKLYEKSEDLFLEAKRLDSKVFGEEHPRYARTCSNLATLYMYTGQYNNAERLYLEAKQKKEKTLGKEHSDYVETCINIGNLYWRMNRYEKANSFYKEALGLRKIQVRKIFHFTSEVEQQSYITKNNELVKEVLSFKTSTSSHSLQSLSYDLSLSNRNLILSSSQQLRRSINNSSDTGLKTKYNNWIDKKEQLSFWYAKPIDKRPAYVKDLEDQSNTLEKELNRLSSAFEKEQSNNEITWKDIQQMLKPNEAAIEFVEFNYYDGKRWTDSTYYIALLLRKDKPEPELIQLFEKKQLDSLLIKSENLTTDNKINSLYFGNTALYNLSWKPLEKYLTGITKIYFSAAGDLFKISFAALPVSSKHVLGDKYQLIQLNTTAAVTDNIQNSITALDKIQLYGGITYDADSTTLKEAVSAYEQGYSNSRSLPADLTRGSNFQYLAGTKKEVDEVKKLAGITSITVSLYNGVNATEESFKALNGKASSAVIHIATHGFFFPDPKEDKRDSIQRNFETSGKVFKQSDNPLFRSGLLFAGANNAWQGNPIEGIEDGVLTAYEVSNMYLPNTKLVVLSACETALGDIQGSEGVYGLQRAFKMAGVQNLVMSLWKVPDAETAEFMKLFYKNMFNKQSVNDAFYNAQKVMKNKYRNEPYKWAAWVMVK